MVKAIVAASLAWPLVLGVALWQRAEAPSVYAAVVYYGASHVCHQRPERSFHSAGVAWPVCGRCAGLYLAAPFGALLALGRRRVLGTSAARWLLAAAAAPTALTLGLEWLDLAPIGNVARWVAALPLGAAVAFVLVRTAAGMRQPIGYTGGS